MSYMNKEMYHTLTYCYTQRRFCPWCAWVFKVGSNSSVDGLNGDRTNGDFHGGGGVDLHGGAGDGIHMATPGRMKLYAFVDLCMNEISMTE